MTTTVAEFLVNCLIANGNTSIYGLPGVQNDEFFDALYGVKDKLRLIHTRHEQAAAYMATGAAQATGRSQVCCVVPGPGFLNAAAALATARSTNARVLAVVGEIPSFAIGRGYGMLHEIQDQYGILERLTKFASAIPDGETAFTAIEGVLSALEHGRPSTVGLCVPTDKWNEPVPNGGQLASAGGAVAPVVDEDALDRAAELLRTARRPLIVVGGGAQSASPETQRFARALTAPVTAFRNGHGVVPSNDPLFVSYPVAHRLWRDADVLVALGTRMQSQLMQWGIDDELKIVQIDIDADAIGRICKPEVGIHADLSSVLPLLSSAIEGRCNDKPRWLERIEEARSAVEAEIEAKLPLQLDYLRAIRDVLPRDGIFVDEVTQIGYVSKFAFPCFSPRTYISAGHQGNLGAGFPMALGAAHARRDVPVISISGDGGFMYAAGELASAVMHGIPVKLIVFADNAFGNVRRIQQQSYGGRLLGVDLTNPDFAALAENFGVNAANASSPVELRAALQKAIETDGPYLIQVPVGELPNPWEFLLLPLARKRRPVEGNPNKLF